MTTTTTKTLNHSVDDGSKSNSVNATITSTPGFNGGYLGKLPGILKMLELILAVIALGLIAAQREEQRPVETNDVGPVYDSNGRAIDWNQYYTDYHNHSVPLTSGSNAPASSNQLIANKNDPRVPAPFSYLRERFLAGEVYFLCAHSAAITMLVVVLIAYLFHTVSSIIVPKASNVENVMNMVLGLMLLAAGIALIVMTELWKNDPDVNQSGFYRPIMTASQRGARLAAGIIAIINGVLFMVSYSMSKKELDGPKTM